MPAIPPFAVQSGEGRTLRTPTDDRVTVQADTAMTNGSLSVLELVVEPKLANFSAWYEFFPRSTGWIGGR